MLSPEVEERFREIEDNLRATAELQRRGDTRAERLESVLTGRAERMKELDRKIQILKDLMNGGGS